MFIRNIHKIKGLIMTSFSCWLFCHKYVIHKEGEEKPYPGPYRLNGKAPHTRLITFVFCNKCSDMRTLNNYFFEHDEAKE